MKQLIVKLFSIALLLVSANLHALEDSFHYFPPPLTEDAVRQESRQKSFIRIRQIQRILAENKASFPAESSLSLQQPLSHLEKKQPPFSLEQQQKLARVQELLEQSIRHFQQSQVYYGDARSAAVGTTVLFLSTFLNSQEQWLQNRFLAPETARILDRGQVAGIVPGLSDMVTESTVTSAASAIGGIIEYGQDEVNRPPSRPNVSPEVLPERIENPGSASSDRTAQRDRLNQQIHHLQENLDILEKDIHRLSENQQTVDTEFSALGEEVKTLNERQSSFECLWQGVSKRLETLEQSPQQAPERELTKAWDILGETGYQQFCKVDAEQKIDILQNKKTSMEKSRIKLRERQRQYREASYKLEGQRGQISDHLHQLNKRKNEIPLEETELNQRAVALGKKKQGIEHEIKLLENEVDQHLKSLEECVQNQNEKQKQFDKMSDIAFQHKEKLEELYQQQFAIQWSQGKPYRMVEGRIQWQNPDELYQNEVEINDITYFLLNDLVPEVEKVQTELEDLSSKIETIRQSKVKIETTESRYLDRLKITKDELEQLKADRRALITEITNLKKQSDQCTHQLVLADKEITKITEDVDYLESIIDRDQKKQQEATSLSLKLADDINRDTEIAKLRKTLKQHSDRLDFFQASLNNKKVSQVNNKQAYQNVLNELTEKQNQKSELRQQLDQAQARLQLTFGDNPSRPPRTGASLESEFQQRPRQSPSPEQSLDTNDFPEVLRTSAPPGFDQTDSAIPPVPEAWRIGALENTEITTSGWTAAWMTSKAFEWLACCNPWLLKGLIAWQMVKLGYSIGVGWHEESKGQQKFLDAKSLLLELSGTNELIVHPMYKQCPLRVKPGFGDEKIELPKTTGLMVHSRYGQCPPREIPQSPKIPWFLDDQDGPELTFSFPDKTGEQSVPVADTPKLKPYGRSPKQGQCPKPSFAGKKNQAFTPKPKTFEVPSSGNTLYGFTPAPEIFEMPSEDGQTPASPSGFSEAPGLTPAQTPPPDPSPAEVPPAVEAHQTPSPDGEGFTPFTFSENYSGTTALMIHPDTATCSARQPLTVDEVIDIIRPQTIFELKPSSDATAMVIQQNETELCPEDSQTDQNLPTATEANPEQPAYPEQPPAEPELPEQPVERICETETFENEILSNLPDADTFSRMQIAPEFSLMGTLNHLSGVVQMMSLSCVKNLSSRIWRAEQQMHAVKGWLQPEMFSFAYNQGQMAPWGQKSGLYTFVQGFNQSGSFSHTGWGGSGFAWGTIGVVDTRFLAGVILSKQKVQVADSLSAGKLTFESNHFYSLGAWQQSGFEVVGILGAGWPDYRYQNGLVSDRFSAEQWLGYLAVSRRFSFRFRQVEMGVSPMVEYFATRTNTWGHSMEGLPVNIAGINSSIGVQKVHQMGLMLDTDSGSGKQSQSWQIFLGWQQARGKQKMAYHQSAHSDDIHSAESLNNMVYSIGANRQLTSNLVLQLTINGSYGDSGSHQGVNISYTQQF